MTELAPELRIIEYQNEWIVRGRHPFAYEPWGTPQLATLRERYHLDEVIATGATEWEQLLLLREWVHARWDHGWSSARADDALDILARGGQWSLPHHGQAWLILSSRLPRSPGRRTAGRRRR